MKIKFGTKADTLLAEPDVPKRAPRAAKPKALRLGIGIRYCLSEIYLLDTEPVEPVKAA